MACNGLLCFATQQPRTSSGNLWLLASGAHDQDSHSVQALHRRCPHPASGELTA
jgi:hypothetical protein